MTVAARAIKDGGNLGRHLGTRKDRLRFVNLRIGSRRPHELNTDKNDDQDDGNPF
jgi:hypothetical protein